MLSRRIISRFAVARRLFSVSQLPPGWTTIRECQTTYCLPSSLLTAAASGRALERDLNLLAVDIYAKLLRQQTERFVDLHVLHPYPASLLGAVRVAAEVSDVTETSFNGGNEHEMLVAAKWSLRESGVSLGANQRIVRESSRSAV